MLRKFLGKCRHIQYQGRMGIPYYSSNLHKKRDWVFCSNEWKFCPACKQRIKNNQSYEILVFSKGGNYPNRQNGFTISTPRKKETNG